MPLIFTRAYRPYQIITLLVTVIHAAIILIGHHSLNARNDHGAQVMMMASLIDQPSTQRSIQPSNNPNRPEPKRVDSEQSQSNDSEKNINHAEEHSHTEVNETSVATLTMPNPFAKGLDNPKPPYPLLSRRMNEEGRVVLNVCVSLTGLVEKLKLEKTSGYQRLDHIAIETVKKWKFIPAKHQDRDINACYLLPVQFILRKENLKLSS